MSDQEYDDFDDFDDLDDLESDAPINAWPGAEEFFGEPLSKKRNDPKFLIGRLLIVWPQSIEHFEEGRNGAYDAVKCRLALLDGPPIEGFEDAVPPTIPAEMSEAMFHAGNCVRVLKRRIDAGKFGPVVQRMDRKSVKGGNYAYGFVQASPEEVEQAKAYLRARKAAKSS